MNDPTWRDLPEQPTGMPESVRPELEAVKAQLRRGGRVYRLQDLAGISSTQSAGTGTWDP